MWCLLIFTLFCTISQFVNGAVNVIDIDPAKTIAWGAGLNPENITLRARYIFVQLVYKNGKKLVQYTYFFIFYLTKNHVLFAVSQNHQEKK